MNEMQFSQYWQVSSLLQPNREPLELAITARATGRPSGPGINCKIWSQTSELTYRFTQLSLTREMACLLPIRVPLDSLLQQTALKLSN